jgi:hypothetical protein
MNKLIVTMIVGLLGACLIIIVAEHTKKPEPEPTKKPITLATEQQRMDQVNKQGRAVLTNIPCPYIGDVPEIKEWKVEDNNLFLAFSSRPPDWKTITCVAAANFWEKHGGLVYAWAIRGCDLNNGVLRDDWRFYGYRTLGDGEDTWQYGGRSHWGQ